MKSMATVALIVAITALPVCAQRGMAPGGLAGHGAFVGHGGVSAPSASRFAPAGRPFSFSPPPTFNRPLSMSPASRPASFNHYPVHAPNLPVYRRRGAFITTVVPGIYPYYSYPVYPSFYDEGNDSQPYPSNEQAAPPDYGPASYPDYGAYPYPYYAPVPPPAQSQIWQSPNGQYLVFTVPPAAPAMEEPLVTVIFRNGRAPEQIRNYLLTPTTLIVLDQPYRQIPLDQIDIAATAETNRKAGVDFRLPR